MDKIYSRPRINFLKINKQGKNKDSKKREKVIKIIVIFIIALTTAKIIIDAITPIIDKNCSYIAKNNATKISNEQAAIVMEKYKYDDLCTISKDTNGNITMLSSNVLLINEIVSNITLKIQEELSKKENSSFDVKLGSFTGIKILSGRGPNVNVKIVTVGGLETELKSEFVTSGINQTIHRIYLQISCNISILTPFETKEEKIVNQVLLAEAVIVGTTPSTYYNFDNTNDDIALETIQ